MESMKGKVIRDIRNQEAKRKQLQKEVFNQRYNATKEAKFIDKEDINMNSFRAIPKSVIQELGLSKAALAVYPVLCCEANFEKDETFHISQKNICLLYTSYSIKP